MIASRIRRSSIRRSFSQFYSFKTGLPLAFEAEKELPPMQKEYARVIFEPNLNGSDKKDVDILYRLYIHAIATRKPYILKGFAEPKLADRIGAFCELLNETGLKLKFNEKIDSQLGLNDRVKKCPIRKTVRKS